jgi:hypothetical protein
MFRNLEILLRRKKVIFHLFAVLGIEPGASCMLSKYSPTPVMLLSFFFLLALGFELRALGLLGRDSPT